MLTATGRVENTDRSLRLRYRYNGTRTRLPWQQIGNEGNQSKMVNKQLPKRGAQSPGMDSILYFSEAEVSASRLSCNFGFFMASKACKYE